MGWVEWTEGRRSRTWLTMLVFKIASISLATHSKTAGRATFFALPWRQRLRFFRGVFFARGRAVFVRMSAKHFAFRGADAWRKHPIFSWGWKEALPDIREGTAAFGLYLIYDKLSHRKTGGGDHHGGEHGHGDDHHGGHGGGGAAAPGGAHH